MLKNQTQVPLPDEYSTIISTIPVNPDVLRGNSLAVLVQWENRTPAYFVKYKDSFERISAPDLLTAINTRLRLSSAWMVCNGPQKLDSKKLV